MRGTGPFGTGGLTGGGRLPQPARFGQAREERGGFLRFLWRSLALLTLAALVVLWVTRLLWPADQQRVPALAWRACMQATSRERCVIDGDSIRLDGETVRLSGLDAPELAGACQAERIAARAAREALLAWLNAGAFTVAEPGGGDRDKYGRPLRTLRRGGSDAAEALIAQGLAQPYTGGARTDWCGANRSP